MEVLLACACGKQLTVEGDSAGVTVLRACGREMSAAPRLELEHGPEVEERVAAAADIPPIDGPSLTTAKVQQDIISAEQLARLPSFAGKKRERDDADDRSQILVHAMTIILQMQPGFDAWEIESKLVAQGFDREAVRTIVFELREARRRQIREQGRRNMLIGSTVCFLGLGSTVCFLGLAAAAVAFTIAGGGLVFLGWGAIVFGGFQFFYGLLQAIFGSN